MLVQVQSIQTGPLTQKFCVINCCRRLGGTWGARGAGLEDAPGVLGQDQGRKLGATHVPLPGEAEVGVEFAPSRGQTHLHATAVGKHEVHLEDFCKTPATEEKAKVINVHEKRQVEHDS
jgi:hypothetical protein